MVMTFHVGKVLKFFLYNPSPSKKKKTLVLQDNQVKEDDKIPKLT